MSHDRKTEVSEPAIRKNVGQLDVERERRSVLRGLGRFAVVTGPAVTLLLAASTKPNRAVASS